MATFKLVNQNNSILEYITEKAQEEFGASVSQEENTLTIECADDVVEDILLHIKWQIKATTGGLVNWGGKKDWYCSWRRKRRWYWRYQDCIQRSLRWP